MPVHYSALASAPPYQTCFSKSVGFDNHRHQSLYSGREPLCLRLYTPSCLSTMDRMIVESEEESEKSHSPPEAVSTATAAHSFPTSPSHQSHTKTDSQPHSPVSASRPRFHFVSHSTPSSPLQPLSPFTLSRSSSGPEPVSSSATTRSRAMGSLSEAFERRRAKENVNTLESIRHKPTLVLAGGAINPKRDEKKALGLRAAVGSYKMRRPLLSLDSAGPDDCNSSTTSPASSSTESHPASPKSDISRSPSDSFNTISPFSDQTLSATRSLSGLASIASSQLNHSQYLAARRQSIMHRIGGHRRVVSETTVYVPEPIKSRPLSPPGPLPSLDQIRSWAAHRKNIHTDPADLRTSTQTTDSSNDPTAARAARPKLVTHGPVSHAPRKSKTLPIFAHARDPSIPRICLSPDSDDEDGTEDEDTQSEPPCSALPLPIHAGGPLSANSTLQSGRNAVNLARALLHSSVPSSPNRAEQRQALLTNLALARRRRTADNDLSAHGFQIVAPV